MDMQFWYEAARETVDDVIESHFEHLSPEAHRKLARVWQYLRDQEVREIQSGMQEKPLRSSSYSFSASSIASPGAAD